MHIKQKLICSGAIFISQGFEEIIIPSIWESKTFVDKSGGSEILEQMYSFKDQKNNSICLVPEITGIIQELFRNNLLNSNPNYTRKLFYISRCYRYEQTPQLGRQREFTQLGVEIVTTEENKKIQYKNQCVELLKTIFNNTNTPYNFVESVKRGLTYYIEDGFEVECEKLGSQKQIAGGGMYKEGVGFAIGLERWILASSPK
jgi:histidyl-tRNA synthetase